VQYHFYRVEGENGPISETARPVGTNEEVPLIKAYKKTTNKTTFIWPEQAEFIKSCVDTDQLEAPSDDISILYDGTGPPPDEDLFEKKLKQENPREEKDYQETVEEMRGLKDIRDCVHNRCGSNGKEDASNQSYMQECFDSLSPHIVPILGATVIISGAVYLVHYIKQGEYRLARSGFWSSWKSEESLDILMSISLNSFARELKKDIDAYYHSEKDPIDCFIQDIEEEAAEIESWLVFRDKCSLIFGSYAYGLYTFADENLALLNRMKKAAFVLRKNENER
jgi:hypothetical protein